MIVDEFDLTGATVTPGEADAKLVVHADGVLAGAVAFQSLQPVGRGRAEVVNDHGAMDHAELAAGDLEQVGGEALGGDAVKGLLRSPILEALDHDRSAVADLVSLSDTRGKSIVSSRDTE